MSRAVWTDGADLLCAHRGVAAAISASNRVLVEGRPVLTSASMLVSSGCSVSAPGPCVSAQAMPMGSRVLAGGQPVLGDGDTALSFPAGTPATVVTRSGRVTLD